MPLQSFFTNIPTIETQILHLLEGYEHNFEEQPKIFIISQVKSMSQRNNFDSKDKVVLFVSSNQTGSTPVEAKEILLQNRVFCVGDTDCHPSSIINSHQPDIIILRDETSDSKTAEEQIVSFTEDQANWGEELERFSRNDKGAFLYAFAKDDSKTQLILLAQKAPSPKVPSDERSRAVRSACTIC